MIVASHSELRCPECRILIEHKNIDDLPPNVLLMRILEGMKNTCYTVPSHSTGVETKAIALALNNRIPIQQVIGVYANSNSRDQIAVNKTVPLNQQITHKNDQGNITNLADVDESHHGSNPPKRHIEGLSSQNSTNTQNIDNSVLTPYAKALYNFDSEDPG